MSRKPFHVTSFPEICVAPLDRLSILSATPDFSYYPANLYVVNPDESGEDIYIGELADARLRNLVCVAPHLEGKLKEIEPGNEDLDDLLEVINLIREALNP